MKRQSTLLRCVMTTRRSNANHPRLRSRCESSYHNLPRPASRYAGLGESNSMAEGLGLIIDMDMGVCMNALAGKDAMPLPSHPGCDHATPTCIRIHHPRQLKQNNNAIEWYHDVWTLVSIMNGANLPISTRFYPESK